MEALDEAVNNYIVGTCLELGGLWMVDRDNCVTDVCHIRRAYISCNDLGLDPFRAPPVWPDNGEGLLTRWLRTRCYHIHDDRVSV